MRHETDLSGSHLNDTLPAAAASSNRIQQAGMVAETEPKAVPVPRTPDIAIAAIDIAATCRGGAGHTAPGGGCMLGHSNSFIVLCGCQQLFSPSESCWIGLPISRIQGDFAGSRNFRLMDAF
eukprot:COSAG01_NODE_10302_length_2197_cov_16.611058_1_plen_121_part_10